MSCPNANIPVSQLSKEDAEAAVLCLINEERAAQGRSTLTLNTRLRAAARSHAQAAAVIKWWPEHKGEADPHTNPVTGTGPVQRAVAAGYGSPTSFAVGENAFDQLTDGPGNATTPQDAFDWWLQSPGHKANLLDPKWRESGVGVVLGVPTKGHPNSATGAIFVQDFGETVKPDTSLATTAVWDWGRNGWGDLGIGVDGDGGAGDSARPVQPIGLPDVVAISAGNEHNLALKDDGSVWSWGSNQNGQLGIGDPTQPESTTPIQVDGLPPVISIVAGSGRSFAIDADGELWAWGNNAINALGDGSGREQYAPVRVSAAFNRVAVFSSGGTHNLLIDADAVAWCWGANAQGQLGIGSHIDQKAIKKLPLPPGVSGFTAVSAGFAHSLAVAAGDGQVWAWGRNENGQLGAHTPLGWQETAIKPQGPLVKAVAVSAGTHHSVALLSDGSVWGWGNNKLGQLGLGQTGGDVFTPEQLPGLNNIIAISVGFKHSLALGRDGTVFAFGDNENGQLGDGTNQQRPAPTPIPLLRGTVAIGAGDFHSLAGATAGSTG